MFLFIGHATSPLHVCRHPAPREEPNSPQPYVRLGRRRKAVGSPYKNASILLGDATHFLNRASGRGNVFKQGNRCDGIEETIAKRQVIRAAADQVWLQSSFLQPLPCNQQPSECNIATNYKAKRALRLLDEGRRAAANFQKVFSMTYFIRVTLDPLLVGKHVVDEPVSEIGWSGRKRW